jgi:aspartate racemase
MSRTVIGILAGMGPRTTSPFLEAVLDRCRQYYGASLDEDYPDIVIYSLPTPFRPNAPLDRLAMQAALGRGAAALARAGAHFIAVPCNVVHLFHAAIQAAAGIEVLHIVDETLQRLPTHPAGATSVLCTRALAESRLYHDALAARGYEVVNEPKFQSDVDGLILAFKAAGAADATVALWLALQAKLARHGVSHAVLACTDLAFCAKHGAGLQMLDSAAILADATVAAFCRREGLAATLSPSERSLTS